MTCAIPPICCHFKPAMIMVLLALLATAFAGLVDTIDTSLGQDNVLSTVGLVSNTSRFNTILRVDNGTYGPAIEEVHYYWKYWPIGLSVSSKSRIFVCYTRGTYDYTVSEVSSKNSETPYPANLNLPADKLNVTAAGTPFGSNNKTGLISVQALYITPETVSRPETLWLLDTGRPTVQGSDGSYSMPYAQPDGPKVVGVSLVNNSVYATYTFPPSVYFPDSYMNDIRFDLRRNVSGTGGKGIAYIVDSSDEGRPGFIMLDLASGKSWRRLTQHPSVLRTPDVVPSYQGHPFYVRSPKQPLGHLKEGADGMQISPDGNTIYYSPLTSDHLYSVPTANLRVQDDVPWAEQAASNNVTSLGQRGGQANGFEGDSNGLVYQLMPEHNALYYYDPRDLQAHPFVEDPRILWPDSASVSEDGYIYVNINQLFFQPAWNNGHDLRQFPGAILRAKLPGNGTKIMSLYD